MSPIIYVSLISGILNILIGSYVFYLNPKKAANRVFAFFVLLFAIFCISEFFAITAETKDIALIGGRICYSVVVIAGCIGVHFSTVFPRKYPNDPIFFARYKYLLYLLYIVSIVLVIIFNMFMSINDVQQNMLGYSVNLSDSTSFILYWYGFCGLYILYSFLHTYFKKNITNGEKKQIKFVAFSLLLLAIFSFGTNLVPPLFDMHVIPLTSASLTLFSIIIAYSMIKYKLMALTTAETADIVVDTMADSLIVVNEAEIIVNANKAAIDIFGFNEREILGKPLKDTIEIPGKEKIKDNKILNTIFFKKLFENGKLKDAEVEFLTKSGKRIPMNLSASLIYGSNKKIEGTVIVARDLTETKKLINALEESKNKLEEKVNERTKEIVAANKELQNEIKERKNAEKQIKKNLKEKEILLREIHHRVKNNLQIISSLLDLQAGHLEGKEASDLICESQNRVKSMALIHEQLYQSEDIGNVNFKEYINSLVSNLANSYGADIKNLSFKIDVRDVLLNIDSAIPCGLIIAELVSNSLKHAFPNSRNAKIIINFTLDKDNNYVLNISDNGVGLPKNFDFKNTESLGLQLVNMLVQQLKGKISVDVSSGTTFKIIFPKVMKSDDCE